MRNRWKPLLRPAAAGLALLAGALMLAVLVRSAGDDEVPRLSESPLAIPTPALPNLTTPPTQPAAPSDPGFPTTACQPAQVAAGGALGVGVPRPARLLQPGPERTAYDAAVACLRSVGGTTPVLRTQLPIDVTRRTTPPGNELAELTAFAQLLNEQQATGVVSVRSHDFTRCGRRGAPRATERTELAPGEALGTCEYPSVALYAQLLTELRAALAAAAPTAQLTYTAWNEPDHPMFTLLSGLGSLGAARQAGRYWAAAAAQVGPDHVLAGEFSDRDLPALLRLRAAFLEGTGGAVPPAWAIHPYRDLTAGAGAAVLAGFQAAVAPAPVWLTEVTARLSGRGGLSGEAGAQRAKGVALRAALAAAPMHVMLYLVTPPAPPTGPASDGWDSALADRDGQARPFVCGLAGLPATDCPGSPQAFGT